LESTIVLFFEKPRLSGLILTEKRRGLLTNHHLVRGRGQRHTGLAQALQHGQVDI
jgi:hypothetical protein